MLANQQTQPNSNVVENNPWLYLKPPATALNIRHDQKYIKYREGKDSIRKIFYLVPFDAFEERNLTEFEALIKMKNIELPWWWNRSEMLRWLYSSHFDLPKSIDNLKTHLKWFADFGNPTLSAGGLKMLQEGIMYQYGRDSQLRPVIVINIYQLDTKRHTIEDFISALVYILNLVKRNMFLPGYIESWVILLDTNELGITSMPISFVKQIISLTQANYPSSLHRLYILNPSFFLSTGWNMVKGLIDPETVEKINFLKKSDFDVIWKVVPKPQLEKRFGGDVVDLKEGFWPPRLTHDDPNVVVNTTIYEPGWDPMNYKVVNWKSPIQVPSPGLPSQNQGLQPVPVVQPLPLQQPIQQQQPMMTNGGYDNNVNGGGFAYNASQPVQPQPGAPAPYFTMDSGKPDPFNNMQNNYQANYQANINNTQASANVPAPLLAGGLSPANLGPGATGPAMEQEKKEGGCNCSLI